MRMKALVVALAAAGTALLSAAPAAASICPEPTESHPTRVGVVWVTVCWYPHDL